MLKLGPVLGDSLSPEYKKGDFVLVSRIPFLFGRPRVGDIVAFRQPEIGLALKQVEAVEVGGARFIVIGTHPLSTDSRHFGPVAREDLVGVVIFHFPQGQSWRGFLQELSKRLGLKHHSL